MRHVRTDYLPVCCRAGWMARQAGQCEVKVVCVYGSPTYKAGDVSGACACRPTMLSLMTDAPKRSHLRWFGVLLTSMWEVR